MSIKDKISGGLYLVVDPSMEQSLLLDKLKQALKGGAQIVQVFDNWHQEINKKHTLDAITAICQPFHVPVIINNHTELLKETAVNGIHFDTIPPEKESVAEFLSKEDYIVGITCGNDLEIVKWAHANQLDYISFCSMFPSSSVDTCEIVSFETVEKAREITDIPIFLSGGINMQNINSLDTLSFNGIAVISGIMKAQDVENSTKEYMKSLQNTGNK
ncbi:MAG: thiamine phosphate synthase [Bacteroidetes bacterium]|nr:thiamine phosphate synthase [Bacteroidota bacterium]